MAGPRRGRVPALRERRNRRHRLLDDRDHLRPPAREVTKDGTILGSVEPITIDATTWVVGLVSSPRVMVTNDFGVGDTWSINDERPESCTDTRGQTGPGYTPGSGDCQHPHENVVDAITNQF